MSKIVDFFMQNARTIGIVYVVGAVVVFLAMTAFYIWVDRASKKEQELYYDEYYYPDDEFAERMSVVVWFILSLGCAILFMLWTERRWSEQSETFISPENPSMYSLNSYKSIQTKKEDGIRKRVSSLCYNGFMNVLEFWQSTHPAKLLNS